MALGPLMVDIAGETLTADDRAVLRHPLVGSVILFARNYSSPGQLTQLCAQIVALRQPALLIGVDQEGGRVQRFREGFTRLPPMRAVGHVYDASPRDGTELATTLGWLLASELRAAGVDFSFAPCVDLDYGASEVIGDRAFHARADAVAELAVAALRGMREAGMAGVAKHFPGHGAVIADSHYALPVDRRGYADLEAEFTPYRRLIANGVPAIMASHVLFPAVDALPASLSRRWLTAILRGELGFKGVIYTDDLGMAGVREFGDPVELGSLALDAGADVIVCCNDRAGVLRILDELRVVLPPAGPLRQARMRGREHLARDVLFASDRHLRGRAAALACAEPPPLELTAGKA